MARRSFGSIEKRGHNSYRIKWVGEDGKPHKEPIKGPRILAEERLSEIQLGMYGGRKSTTYRQYWDDTVEPSFAGLAPKTISEYNRLWSVELEPRIGEYPVSDTDWRYVQQTLDDVKATSVQKKCFVLWRKMLNMAIRDRLVTNNPCDRSIRLRRHKKREKMLLEASEVKGWMDKIHGIKYEPVLLCLLGGGLRPSEALALNWSDIGPYRIGEDEYALVSVSKTVVLVDGKPVRQDGTKTAMSNRKVVIGRPFAARLLELKGEGNLSDTSPSTVSHNWKQWCERNDVKYVSLANMRSTYATMHGTAGSIDSIVSMSMGHSDGTTKGVNYQSATLKGLAMIADNLAELIDSETPAE